MTGKVQENQRQRAPSKRSLATRERIFDAAEQLFAERGFEGATIRDIARLAGVQGALVNHHGGSKEVLFATIVARRADELLQQVIPRREGHRIRPRPGLELGAPEIRIVNRTGPSAEALADELDGVGTARGDAPRPR